MGHGTNMAGSVLFSDLTYPLGGQEKLTLPFILESVKLIPPPEFLPTDAENYGSITKLLFLSLKSTLPIESGHSAWQSRI